MRYLRGNSRGIWNDAKKHHALAGRVAFATIPLNASCYRLFAAEFWMKKGVEIGLIGDSYNFIRGQLFGIVKVLIHKGLWGFLRYFEQKVQKWRVGIAQNWG